MPTLVVGLQWVHGLGTVVMVLERDGAQGPDLASMGPRSGNRGYACSSSVRRITSRELQWVHGLGTVVMGRPLAGRLPRRLRFNGSTVWEPWLWTALPPVRTTVGGASMGPRSGNRGYAGHGQHGGP